MLAKSYYFPVLFLKMDSETAARFKDLKNDPSLIEIVVEWIFEYCGDTIIELFGDYSLDPALKEHIKPHVREVAVDYIANFLEKELVDLEKAKNSDIIQVIDSMLKMNLNKN